MSPKIIPHKTEYGYPNIRFDPISVGYRLFGVCFILEIDGKKETRRSCENTNC